MCRGAFDDGRNDTLTGSLAMAKGVNMNRDLVAIGGSSGSVEALQTLVRQLDAKLPAAVMVVVHVPPTSASVLPQILQRVSKLPVAHAVQGEAIVPGRVYVAPPDRHLLVHGDRVQLTRGPRENSHRPAVDPLFRSAARWRGARAIGVVVSGALDDGTAGAIAMKARGGKVFVQSSDDATFASMPESVVRNDNPDAVLTAADLGRWISERTRDEVGTEPVTTTPMDICDEEVEFAEGDPVVADSLKQQTQGPASGFTCPDCSGALWELRQGELIRYRCRTGHAHAQESLLAAQLDTVEEAMWTAYRTLEETAGLSRSLALRAEERGHAESARLYRERETDSLERARAILGALTRTR
jgi:two-component system chemotaxis response regulator CheB